MAYTHGVYVQEQPTSIIAPITSDSALQVVIGIAPINMGDLKDPLIPKLAYTFDEAVKKIGFSRDYNKFTLMQSLVASFEIYNVAPVVFINVLDPKTHKKTVTTQTVSIADKVAIIKSEGILLDTVKVTSITDEELTLNTDYSIAFSNDGFVIIEVKAGGAILPSATELKVAYTALDPTMVNKNDIIAGIDLIKEVYPRFNLVPGLILAPGYSHEIEVYNALTAKTTNLNGQFSCMALVDVDTTVADTYEKVNEFKKQNSYTDKNSIVLWPRCQIGDSVFAFSAVAGAHTARTDAENDNVPYVSPSNTSMKISGICDGLGKEIILDAQQANLLNGQGVCTAINMNGWRFWGNRTGCYPASSDVKDSFIPVRRMFCWWGNTFILTYFQKVDNPMNKRLIEAVVDSENIRAGGFKARYQIADAYMEFLIEDNPQTDLLNGVIRFKQHLTPFPPAETIINVLEFDPAALQNSLM